MRRTNEAMPIHVADCLGRGQSAAIPLRHLKLILGLDGRTIRLMIEQERRDGVPICADNQHGYFLASCEAERAAFVRSMQGRAQEILRTAAAVEAAEVEP